jgi:uncharacterized protein YciI
MPHFLYRIQPTRPEPTERKAKVVGEHFEYLQAFTAEGTVLTAGRTLTADERTLGILLVGESEARAAAIMPDDPAVKHGVMRPSFFRIASRCARAAGRACRTNRNRLCAGIAVK